MGVGVLIGIVLTVLGLSSFYPPTRDWFIKTTNAMQGTKTKITSGTILWAQISGVVLILFGLGILYSAFTTQ